MKIKIEEINNLLEEEIVIKCKEQDKRISDIVASLKLFDKTITGKKAGRIHLIPVQDVFYFESVDDKVFCYTKEDIYETSFKLYEIEDIYANTNLVRINKNMIVDINKILSFKAQLNGRMDAIMQNGEKVEISRNYVPQIKAKLGGIKK